MDQDHISWTQRARLFQKCAILIGSAFFLIMVVVVVIAFGRRSGNTGMDPAKIQVDRLRHHQTESIAP